MEMKPLEKKDTEKELPRISMIEKIQGTENFSIIIQKS